MRLSKRRILKGIGVTTSVFAIESVSANTTKESTEQDPRGDERPDQNFGIFNNNTRSESIEVSIFNSNKTRISDHRYDLEGRNGPGDHHPNDTKYKGKLSVKGQPNGSYRLEANTSDGRNDSTSIRVENGNVSQFQIVSVYVRPDNTVKVRNCWR